MMSDIETQADSELDEEDEAIVESGRYVISVHQYTNDFRKLLRCIDNH